MSGERAWQQQAGYGRGAGHDHGYGQPQPYSPPQPEPLPTPYVPHQSGPYGAGATTTPTGGRNATAPRTTSPLIAPGFQPAALTTVLAALIGGAAQLGSVPLAVAVALLQAVTAAGWFRLNGMWPARQGIALAFLAGLATDAGLLIADGGHAPAVVLGTLGIWCVLTMVVHLRNHSAPDERLYALTAAFTSTALTVLAAGHLVALGTVTADVVTTGAAGAAVAVLARALPLPAYVSPVVALLAAVGAGVAAGELTGLGGGPAAGGLPGLAAGGCALIGLRVASYDFPSRFVHMTAGVALPLALAGPAVYLVGRAVA